MAPSRCSVYLTFLTSPPVYSILSHLLTILYTFENDIKVSSNVLLCQFMRNSKAVGVLWGIFTVCYTVLIIVVFLQVSISWQLLDSRYS